MKIWKQLVLPVIILVAGGFVTIACEAEKPADSPAAGQPRVFFEEPKDGATVTSPMHMKFGSEGIQIGAVPPGELTKAQVRPGIAHYHVGIDQSCLPAGQTIVKGTPSWVHFGDGKDVFDTQLTPGEHKLALQLGDDLHDTLPGTCQEITVTVK
jgi:hypothetical protein